MTETIRMRRSRYQNADSHLRIKLEEEAADEVSSFRTWLEQTKRLEPTTAYYFAISLKSILVGLPISVQIAYLFGIVLDRNPSLARLR
jgi:hypothetical protein